METVNGAIRRTDPFIRAGPLSSPMTSLAGGAYARSQSFQILDGTAAEAVYYTTDGTTPTASSSQYTGPIAISNPMAIKAIAAANALSEGDVSSSS